MPDKLFYNTVSPLLHSVLKKLMHTKELAAFRLVGGTALSLQKGHRFSEDIDLFSDAEYNSIDFNTITDYLRSEFAYMDTSSYNTTGMGRAYYAGKDESHCIKIDIFYTDAFIRPALTKDTIRLAAVEDIIAMKLDVIARGGRKKDFWDLHELMETYTIKQMLALHKERYPYAHNKKEILRGLVSFGNADNDFNPACLRGKYWEVIKLDVMDAVRGLK